MSGGQVGGGRGTDPAPTVPIGAVPMYPPADPRLGRGVRMLDAVAGVLAAGCVLLGVLLLALHLLAPSALAGWGVQGAVGPGWPRVAGHLAVGLIGEAVVCLRRRWTAPVRSAADAGVVVVALAVLGWAWWS